MRRGLSRGRAHVRPLSGQAVTVGNARFRVRAKLRAPE
jgi:hypothetical protein